MVFPVLASASQQKTDDTVDSPVKKGAAEQFIADMEKYSIEPGWVVVAFLEMELTEFDKAWEHFMSVLHDAPWKFFANRSKDYSEKKCRELFIAHCAQYDVFLQNLLVDVANKRLFLVTGAEKTNALKKGTVITVWQYWKMKKTNSYQHFYAFYFDRIIMQLYETVITAWCQHDTPDYFALHKRAHSYSNKLHAIFKHLKSGMYDERYAYHLKRYQELLELLQKERKEHMAGAL